LAPAGFSTNIHLSRQIQSYPPNPYTNCTINLETIDSYHSDFFKKVMQSKSKYVVDECRGLCFNKMLEEKCNCSSPSFISYYGNRELCTSPKSLECQVSNFQNFLDENGYDKCDCPQPCESIIYSYISTMAEYPTKSYANILMKNPMIRKTFENESDINYDNVRKRVVSVNILYNDLIETSVIAQQKTDWINLFSNIGGILGLFLGKKSF
jgi:hypothetical protein